MTAESLNCPNCGAGVASDSPQCEFCHTRLMTMACPSCFGLMFVGSQFCGHCGAKMVTATVHDDENIGDCPRCRLPLESLQIGATSLRECRKCGGIWADVETFQHLCTTREEQSAVLGYIGERESIAEPLAKISYVPCPDCKQLMNRSNFARASGVIIDTCKKHGVWFDADELPRIIGFVQNGGMEIARQREKQEIEDQRDQLREEQRKQVLQDQRFGLGNTLENEGHHEVRSFIDKLFD